MQQQIRDDFSLESIANRQYMNQHATLPHPHQHAQTDPILNLQLRMMSNKYQPNDTAISPNEPNQSLLQPITHEEWTSYWKRKKGGKRGGKSGIAAPHIKLLSHESSEYVRALINYSYAESYVYKDWGNVVTIPLRKILGCDNPDKLRPIGLLELLRKCATGILSTRLQQNWLRSGCIDEAQSGGVPHRSTSCATLITISAIEHARAHKLTLTILEEDKTKAFDTAIWGRGKEMCLRRLGVDENTLQYIHKLDKSTQFQIETAHGLSPPFYAGRGWIQGDDISMTGWIATYDPLVTAQRDIPGGWQPTPILCAHFTKPITHTDNNIVGAVYADDANWHCTKGTAEIQQRLETSLAYGEFVGPQMNLSKTFIHILDYTLPDSPPQDELPLNEEGLYDVRWRGSIKGSITVTHDPETLQTLGIIIPTSPSDADKVTKTIANMATAISTSIARRWVDGQGAWLVHGASISAKMLYTLKLSQLWPDCIRSIESPLRQILLPKLHLPTSFPKHLLWLHATHGGIGMASWADITGAERLKLALDTLNRNTEVGNAVRSMVADIAAQTCCEWWQVLTPGYINRNTLWNLGTWLGSLWEWMREHDYSIAYNAHNTAKYACSYTYNYEQSHTQSPTSTSTRTSIAEALGPDFLTTRILEEIRKQGWHYIDQMCSADGIHASHVLQNPDESSPAISELHASMADPHLAHNRAPQGQNKLRFETWDNNKQDTGIPALDAISILYTNPCTETTCPCKGSLRTLPPYTRHMCTHAAAAIPEPQQYIAWFRGEEQAITIGHVISTTASHATCQTLSPVHTHKRHKTRATTKRHTTCGGPWHTPSGNNLNEHILVPHQCSTIIHPLQAESSTLILSQDVDRNLLHAILYNKARHAPTSTRSHPMHSSHTDLQCVDAWTRTHIMFVRLISSTCHEPQPKPNPNNPHNNDQTDPIQVYSDGSVKTDDAGTAHGGFATLLYHSTTPLIRSIPSNKNPDMHNYAIGGYDSGTIQDISSTRMEAWGLLAGMITAWAHHRKYQTCFTQTPAALHYLDNKPAATKYQHAHALDNRKLFNSPDSDIWISVQCWKRIWGHTRYKVTWIPAHPERRNPDPKSWSIQDHGNHIADTHATQARQSRTNPVTQHTEYIPSPTHPWRLYHKHKLVTTRLKTHLTQTIAHAHLVSYISSTAHRVQTNWRNRLRPDHIALHLMPHAITPLSVMQNAQRTKFTWGWLPNAYVLHKRHTPDDDLPPSSPECPICDAGEDETTHHTFTSCRAETVMKACREWRRKLSQALTRPTNTAQSDTPLHIQGPERAAILAPWDCLNRDPPNWTALQTMQTHRTIPNTLTQAIQEWPPEAWYRGIVPKAWVKLLTALVGAENANILAKRIITIGDNY